MSRVYLAGPINGISYEDCVGWRESMQVRLHPYGIECLDPMRGKRWLQELPVMDNMNPRLKDDPLTTEKAIISRDFHDCTTSDLVLVNLLGAKSVSIGTCFEMAWCFMRQIPTVVVLGDDYVLHDHPFIRQSTSFKAKTLDDALELIKVILNKS